MLSLVDKLKNKVDSGWTYNRFNKKGNEKHCWTKGSKRLSICVQTGREYTSGTVVKITNTEDGTTQPISNGFVATEQRALILADMYMSENKTNPATFMETDRTTSNAGPENLVKQEKWLEAHSYDYEFDVISREVVVKEARIT